MQIKIRVLEEEDAVSQITASLGERRFIRINGHSGHGKTRLAKAIAAALGWQRVSLDDYLREKTGAENYEATIDKGRLRADIAAAEIGVVVEGILLDRILPPDTFGPELKVFMQSLFTPEFDDDERRRREQFGTEAYMQDFRPDFWAGVIVVKPVA